MSSYERGKLLETTWITTATTSFYLGQTSKTSASIHFVTLIQIMADHSDVPENAQDLTIFVQNLLEQMVSHILSR